MAVTRRTGLGAILGGLFAGPSVAREMSEAKFNIPDMRYKDEKVTFDSETTQIKSPTPYELAQKGAHHKLYVEERIKNLNKIVNGDFQEWQKNELENISNEKEWQRIKSLKSVARTYKEQMMHNYNTRKTANEWIKQAKQELAQLLGMKL